MSYTVIITEEVAANIAVTTQNYPITIEYNATNIAANTSYGNTEVAAFLGSYGSNTISTTGNVTAGRLIGDGSLITNLPAGNYNNANVATFLAAFGSNTISTTGNVTSGNVNTGGRVTATGNITGGNLITAGIVYTPQVEAAVDLDLNATGKVNVNGNVRVGDNNTDTQIATHGTGDLILRTHEGDANQGSITIFDGANGNIALAPNGTGQVTATTISASGNITAANVNGNGSGLSSLTGANVSGTVANAAYATSAGTATTAGTVTTAAQGNITSLGTLTGLNVNGAVSATGNITGNYILGNGSQLTGLPATYSNANVQAYLPTYSGNIGELTVTGNLTVTGSTTTVNTEIVNVSESVVGNVDAGNVRTTGQVSATGNITGNYFIGNGSQLTGIVATSSYGDSNVATLLSTFGSNTVSTTGNVTSGNLITAGIVTATGNINGANVVAAANLTSTQQTVIGTANVGTTGNIVVSGKNIATDMAWNPDGGNAITGALGRVVIGTGWNGNITHNAHQSRLNPTDSISRSNTSTVVRQINSESLVTINGNVTNSSFRQQNIGGITRLGGGSAANTIALTNGVGPVFAVAGGQFNIEIGNITPYFLGNTSVSHAVIHGGTMGVGIGSNITNAFGFNSLISTPVGTTSGNITNYIGYSSSILPAVTGNVFMFYNGNNATSSTTCVQVNNSTRQASKYYFLMNEDDLAQNQLGSLRRYHEFQYATATSGTVNIDKNNAQVQFIAPTANVTIGDFQNFVTTANDGTNNDTQSDTVTLIIQQGATPYTVTMPTGNASIKYAGGISTVGSTANSVTMVNVTAIRSAANATMYLATVSSEFV